MNRLMSVVFDVLFERRRAIRLAIGLLAGVMAIAAATRLHVSSGPDQLYPIGHPTIATHTEFSRAFGSTNAMVVMFRVKEGDLFNRSTLQELAALTRRLENVPAADPYQVVSLASRKLRHVEASSEGVNIEPLMWPDTPTTDPEITRLRERVLSNEMAFGNFVSRDLSAALIVVGFIDDKISRGETDYAQINAAVQAALKDIRDPNIETYVVGEPVLQSVAIESITQTLILAGLIVLSTVCLLWTFMGSWLGTVLPLISAVLSASIALGTISLAGLPLDPLMLVLCFLMASRSVSHSVQFCRLYAEERAHLEPLPAARATLRNLFRPSVLGLAADVGSVAIMFATPIPLLRGAALIGVIWLSSMLVTAIVLIPLVLADLRILSFRDRAWHRPVQDGLSLVARQLATPRGAPIVLLVAAALIAGAAWRATGLQIGDAFPGTPLLWPHSPFNQAVAAIDKRFPGAERMFLVVDGDAPDAIKRADVIMAMGRVQAELERRPEIVGTLSLPDLVAPLNMMLREGNPRFREVPSDQDSGGQLIAMLEQSADPGDLGQYRTQDYSDAAIHMQLRDHRGPTLRAVKAAVDQAIAGLPESLPVKFRFGGGFPAVLTAVNEIIAAHLVETVAFSMALLFACCWISYGFSWQAGLFFLPGVMLSNSITFAYMSWKDIGLTINTLPVLSLGMGMGVDFGFYIVDRIREAFRREPDVREAIGEALQTAGRGVVITGTTMIVTMLLWRFSELRFQAEMGILIALWMAVAVTAALTVVPALALVFRPDFIFGGEHAAEPSAPEPACTNCIRNPQPRSALDRFRLTLRDQLSKIGVLSRLQPLCSVEAVPAASGKPITLADGRVVAVFRTADGFHVVDDNCTHGTASLSEGDYDPQTGHVECPWHGGRFDVRTGLPVAPPVKLPLQRYEVVRRGDELYVELSVQQGGRPAPVSTQVAP
jgi:predicted RND superfamily exporter protein/nitrite reductase/ring-hydroxylating ferredoxin subunit